MMRLSSELFAISGAIHLALGMRTVIRRFAFIMKALKIVSIALNTAF